MPTVKENPTILFISDSVGLLKSYIEMAKLEGLNVDRCDYLEDLEQVLRLKHYDFAVQVSKMSRKPGVVSTFLYDIDDPLCAGVKYGVPLLQKHNIPFVVLSTIPIDYMGMKLGWKKDTLPDGCKGIYALIVTLPSQLVEIIKTQLKK
ncbi:MAG: hypothetical protein WC575_03630 [Patescibacteria group bacterium]